MLNTSATKVTLFSRNHQENNKKSASYQQFTAKSALCYPIIAKGIANP